MHTKIYLLVSLFIFQICSSTPLAQPKPDEHEKLYTRVKIAGVVTASVLGILAYMRVNKFLGAIEAVAEQIQPAIDDTRAALKETHLTIAQVRHVASNAQHVTATINALLNPRVLATPGAQGLIQQTVTSVMSGINASTPTTPPIPPWSPANVAAAVAQHPVLIVLAIKALTAKTPTPPSSRSSSWIPAWLKRS